MLRIRWESENAKWMILVRKFDDGGVDILTRGLIDGKQKEVRHKDLPDYIIDKQIGLRDEINEKARSMAG